MFRPGDIGTGARNDSYLFGQYKKIRRYMRGYLLEKVLAIWWIFGKKQATGYSLLYLTENC